MRHLYSLLTLVFFAFLFYASTEVHRIQSTQIQYEQTQKQAFHTTLSYNLPVITLAPQTQQTQKKDGVTISCSITPFQLDSSIHRSAPTLTYADPDNPDFDVYETENRPTYTVIPDAVEFSITVKNSQDRIIKLNEVAVVSVVDGIQYSLSRADMEEWNGGLVVKGFDKSYAVHGPKLSTLGNAKVIYLSVNDVPVLYDSAGNVKKKENFEWFFQVGATPVVKDAVVSYDYTTEPVDRRQCTACGGRGYTERVVTCSTCKGYGSYINQYNGKRYNCTACGGTGKIALKDVCVNCGGKGELRFPKSKLPPEKSRTEWAGWNVEVDTKPAGANIEVIDVQTGLYAPDGTSNRVVHWLSSQTASYPIIVEYQGKSVKVLPYSNSGKPIAKVSVDFTKGVKVRKGQQVQ
jgi:hypothetical protein